MAQRKRRGDTGEPTTTETDSGEYDYPPRLYLDTKAYVDATLDGIIPLWSDDENSGGPGDTVIARFTDAIIDDGVIYDKEQSEEKNPFKENKFKVFSFASVGLGDEGFDTGEELYEAIDRVGQTIRMEDEPHTEDNIPFRMVGARMPMVDTDGNEFHVSVYLERADDDPNIVENILVDEEAEERLRFDVARMYFGTGDSGPTSAAKTIVRRLTENGEGNLLAAGSDDDGQPVYEDHGWYDRDMQFADELRGERVRLWKTSEPNPSGQGFDYRHLHIKSLRLGQELPNRNASSRDTPSTDSLDDAPTVDVEFSDSVRDVIEWAHNGYQDQPEEALQTALNEDYITEEEIRGQRDEIIQRIQSGDY